MSETPVRLRPELVFSPTRSHDKVAYLVEDHVQQKYWKIGELEYEVCSALDGTRPASACMLSLLENSSIAKTAGPEKVHKILIWLLQSGLVESSGVPQRSDKRGDATASKPKKLFDPSFIRVPLLSSDWIERSAHKLTWLLSFPALLAAVIAWCVSIALGLQNYQELVSLGQKLFVPGSQWWWLLAWFILKAVHESGHAIACTRVGAKTNGAGIGFMFFAPSPYVDVTNLWSVENKWSRILVSASGMLFELTLSALAVIGACTLENPSLQYLCFSVATLGTLTTIAFNANPLMRYDGYYIMIDMFDRPNLWQDASLVMKSFFATWLYRDAKVHGLSIPLLLYGTASWISRMLLLASMGWGVWKTWDGIGLIIVAFFASLWFIAPPVMRIMAKSKTSTPWSFRSSIARISPWKLARCAIAMAVLALCCFLPSPLQVYWPAIVDYVDPEDVRAVAPGFVEAVFVHDGQGVQTGDEILRLSNPALELEYQAALAAKTTSEEKCISLRAQRKHFDLQAEEAVLESLKVKLESLATRVESLRVKAPRDGVLVARMSNNLTGRYLTEGQSVGLIADPAQIEVRASVPQDAWDTISHSNDNGVSIYLESGDRWAGKVLKTLPRTSDTLDSPSLAGLYGGPIAVVMSKTPEGEENLKTNSPRLQTRIALESASSSRSRVPPPGLHCSVHLNEQREAIWQTAYRWIHAIINSRFQDTIN